MYISSDFVLWAVCTAVVTVVPLCLVHLVSYRWLECRGNASPTLRLMHFLQIGLLYRTVALYSTRCRYQQMKRCDLYSVYVYEFIDLAQLQLLLSRLQAGPQLWLQIYLVITYNSCHFVQGASVVCCCVSLLWSCLAYSFCNSCLFVRSQCHVKVNWSTFLLQTFWRVCFLVARLASLLALSLLLSLYTLYLLAVRFAANYSAVTCHTLRHRRVTPPPPATPPDPLPSRTSACLCCSGRGGGVTLDGHVQNAVVALVLCFCDVGSQRSWRCLLIHHCVCVAENIGTAVAFHFLGSFGDTLQSVLPSVIVATTAFGLLTLALDQWRCHSNSSSNNNNSGASGGGGENGGAASDKMAPSVTNVVETSLLSSLHSFSVQPMPSASAAGNCSSPVCVSANVTAALCEHSVSNSLELTATTSSALSGAAPDAVAQSASRTEATLGDQRRTQSDTVDGAAGGDIATAPQLLSAQQLLSRWQSANATAPSRPPHTYAATLQHHWLHDGANVAPMNDSDLGELDYVSEGDITLPHVPAATLNQSAPPAASLRQSERFVTDARIVDSQSAHSTISATANHSRAVSSSAVAPDYENMCFGHAYSAALTVRAWRTYSDIGDSAHEMSVALAGSGAAPCASQRASTAHSSCGGGGGGVVSDSYVAASTKHTYENTDNVQLMLQYLDEEEEETERREEEEAERQLDVSSLVATIDSVTLDGSSPQTAVSVPRRSRSSDNMAADQCHVTKQYAPLTSAASSRRCLNASFDTERAVRSAQQSKHDWPPATFQRHDASAISRRDAVPASILCTRNATNVSSLCAASTKPGYRQRSQFNYLSKENSEPACYVTPSPSFL